MTDWKAGKARVALKYRSVYELWALRQKCHNSRIKCDCASSDFEWCSALGLMHVIRVEHPSRYSPYSQAVLFALLRIEMDKYWSFGGGFCYHYSMQLHLLMVEER